MPIHGRLGSSGLFPSSYFRDLTASPVGEVTSEVNSGEAKGSLHSRTRKSIASIGSRRAHERTGESFDGEIEQVREGIPVPGVVGERFIRDVRSSR